MEKGLAIVFFLLLIMPSVNAAISIDGPDKSVYNLGDDISISGYVLRESALTGQLRFVSNCNSTAFQLPSASVRLGNNEKKVFPNELPIPKITVSSSMSGTCFIETSLVSNNEILETARSKDFEITRSLKGEFAIDQTDVQAGRSFTLTADIFKLDGQGTDGSAEIYFKTNETEFLADIANIKAGRLDYVYNAVAIPSNTYSINVLVNDVFGNRELFTNIATFKLINEISVSAKTDKQSLLPGENVKIFGDALTALEEQIPSGTVNIEIGKNNYKTELNNSSYEKEIALPTVISSGKHKITVTVEDEFGNIGTTYIFISVIPVPTILKNDLGKGNYKPDETIEIRPLLYDQADDPVSDDINVEITGPTGESIFADVLKSNDKIGFRLPRYAKPGLYKITSYAVDLSDEDNINVETVLNAEVSLANQTIFVKNTGNVVYSKPIKVDIDNSEYVIVRRMSLTPDEILNINLFEEVPSGIYDIVVTLGDKIAAFKDIEIIGKEKKSFTLPYTVIALLMSTLLVYLIYSRIRGMPRREAAREKKKQEIRRFKKNIENIKAEKEKKPYRYNFGVAKEDDVRDFRKRILREIKDTEEKGRNIFSRDDKNPNKDTKGMFKMFD